MVVVLPGSYSDEPIFEKVTDIGRHTVSLSDLTDTRFVLHSNGWSPTDMG